MQNAHRQVIALDIEWKATQEAIEKSDGETKSKVGRLISQFQEFAKASFK